MPNADPPDELVTTAQAAALLGKSRARVHQLVQRGELTPVPHAGGTGYRFRRAEVIAVGNVPRRHGNPPRPLDQVSERQRYRRRKQEQEPQ
ncbi:MAG: helix-turn-helix domain-containing protein [Chloroflexaceae bacterium]|nr:helix-turn-helix domain-containing protein [Chloroflexaceae bacterium]